MADRRRTKAELQAENDRLTALLDSDMTYQQLEAKFRDGTISLTATSSEDDTVTHAVLRFVAALCLNALLGEDRVEPENYRSCEFHIKTAGEFRSWRLIAEVVKPGGKSSHEIRRELEAQLGLERPDA